MPERNLSGWHAWRALAFACVVCAWPAGGALAGPQTDPELGPILRAAIDDTGCDEHADHYDEEVWFKLQEPRMRFYVKDPAMRVAILKHAYCETNRVVQRYRAEQQFALRLSPELVLAVMDVESRFDRYAVSSAGAVGLMQVMPFWPRELGVENKLFGNVEFNIRMGVEILAFYMRREKNDYVRALARYNGSVGRRTYPDLVLGRLSSRWRSS
jgi:soluble lytic murein transglycosylase-like protein